MANQTDETPGLQNEKHEASDYVAPKITLYTNEEILDRVGPVVASPISPP